MSILSKEKNFQVTVIIAPTAVRLYAPYYHHFPSITQEPYFINYIGQLARRAGFEVLSLLQELQLDAKEALLHHRDDSHWNDLGNEVVARIISNKIF